jgi:hypothetical protein
MRVIAVEDDPLLGMERIFVPENNLVGMPIRVVQGVVYVNRPVAVGPLFMQ